MKEHYVYVAGPLSGPPNVYLANVARMTSYSRMLMDEGICNPYGLTNYAGSRQMPAELLAYQNWQGKQIENRFSHWIWRQYASAFWDDVRIDRVLPFKASKDEEDEKHVHPLQLDVIDRAVALWSNHGEVVFTPFMGVGSEVFGAVMAGRRGIGVELKASYYRQAKKNLAEADREDFRVGLGQQVIEIPTREPEPST